MQEAASRFLPKHTAAACPTLSQRRCRQCPKDRGAEQGDVDGAWECRSPLGMVAAETRERVAAQQASGSLPWIGVDDPSDIQHLQAAHAVRQQETVNIRLGGPEKLTRADDPRHALAKKMKACWTCGLWTMIRRRQCESGSRTNTTENGVDLLRGRLECSAS